MRIRASASLIAALVLAACTGQNSPSTATAPTPTGGAPTIGSINVFPDSVGLAGVTNFTLSPSTVSNPGGGTVQFSWDFGDGGGTGQTVSHIFQFPNTYNVKLTASNNSGSSTAATSVTTKTLTGIWTGTYDNNGQQPITFQINQNGTVLTGSGTNSDAHATGDILPNSTASASGVVIRINMYTSPNVYASFVFVGSFLNSFDEIKGTITSGTEGFDIFRKKS